MPSWRTETVQMICRSIKATGEWNAMAILADALEDGGFHHHGMLAIMRAGSLSHIRAEKWLAMFESKETMAAVMEIEAIAAELGYEGYPGELWVQADDPEDFFEGRGTPYPGKRLSYDILMKAAHLFNESGGRDHGLFNSMGASNWAAGGPHPTDGDGQNEQRFWKAYQLITGQSLNFEFNRWGWTEFFSCSC